MCAWVPVCQTGYTLNNVTNQCEAIGINCGQNAKWNGMMCCCNSGFSYVSGQCISCPVGTMFDGRQCSPIVVNATVTCGSNEILSKGQCVCQNNFYRINGVCYQCPANTKWNGVYCECNMPTTDWCLGKPYTNYNNGVCSCISGYVNVNGLCVSA
jgi:hypothetical protein